VSSNSELAVLAGRLAGLLDGALPMPLMPTMVRVDLLGVDALVKQMGDVARSDPMGGDAYMGGDGEARYATWCTAGSMFL